MVSSNFLPDYYTATILEWKPLLQPAKYKELIINSFRFLVHEKRAKVYGFVIMSNHIHVIWQALGEHTPKELQLSFMKYTAQMILKDMRNNHTAVLEKFLVNGQDRKYQVWERRPLSVSLWNQKVFKQKLDYIHNNPVSAGLCTFPSDYEYSSASFYLKQDNRWEFLSHYLQ
jgi:REP element-mobilizing transposase RayT